MKTNSDIPWWQHDQAPEQFVYSTGLAPAVEESPLPYWALIAFTFILLMAPQAYYPFLAPLRIALLTAAVAVITHVGCRLTTGRPLLDPSPGLWLVFWLLGWVLLTVPISFWPGGSVAFILDLYIKTIIVFVLLANVVNTVDRLRGICWAEPIPSPPPAAANFRLNRWTDSTTSRSA